MTDRPHVPVLLTETLGLLEPGPGKRIVDGTFGFGGHSQALLEAGAEVLGLDLDETAHRSCLEQAADQPRLQCRRTSFRHFKQAMQDIGWDPVDGVLLDLGVSSLQLDDQTKGFSYRLDGPLDLRFDQDSGETAAELIARLKEKELADLIYEFGEERGSRKIARRLVAARGEEPVDTTVRLKSIVMGAVPRGQKPEPVLSRVFQALRIAVNGELDALDEVLEQLPDALTKGGRCVIISYHSLEDRRVKQFLNREKRDCLCPPELPACVCKHVKTLKLLTSGAVQASNEEVRDNVRARSARLRAAQRI